MRLRNRLRSGRLPCLIAIMGLWLALSAAPARADACSTGVSISASTAAFSPNYDFTDAVQHTTMVTTMRIVGVVNGCGYLIGAEGGGAGRTLSDGMHTMQYQLYTNSQLTNIFLDPLSGATGTAVNMLSFVGGADPMVTLTYYFSIPASQYISSGLYQDDVVLTLYSGIFSNPSAPIDSASASHEATVTGIFLLSLVPTGDPFDINQTSTVIDFGALSPGQSRSVQALFKSNDSTGYKVYMRSDNSNVLKLVGGSATTPYSLALSPSNSPNLTGVTSGPTLTTSDLQIATGTGVAPSSADRLNVSATIGNFSPQAQAPGTYSDVITVTIIGN